MTAMLEDSPFVGFSAGHLSTSYESPPPTSYSIVPLPYRACGSLSTVPVFQHNSVYGTDYNSNHSLMEIHPEEIIGSNTSEPPEVNYYKQVTPHHIITQLQQVKIKSASFSAPSSAPGSPFTYLPPGAFHSR